MSKINKINEEITRYLFLWYEKEPNISRLFGLLSETLLFLLYKNGIKTSEKIDVDKTLNAAKIPRSLSASDFIKNKHKKVIEVVIPQRINGLEMSL